MNTKQMKKMVKVLGSEVFDIPKSYIFKPVNHGTRKRGRWFIKIQHKEIRCIFGATVDDLVRVVRANHLGYWFDTSFDTYGFPVFNIH